MEWDVGCINIEHELLKLLSLGVPDELFNEKCLEALIITTQRRTEPPFESVLSH
jgi:hypothetical protein